MINTGLLTYSASSSISDGVLQTPSILSTTLQPVKDNLGNTSTLSLATNRIGNSSYYENSWISAPTGVANKTMLYFDTLGRMAWRNGTGYTRTFDASTITANRVYTLPDATTTLAGLSVTNNIFTGKITMGTSTGTSLLNFPDAGTTAADGISFGTGNSNLYRNGANKIATAGSFDILGSTLTWNNYNNYLANSGIILQPISLTGSTSTSVLNITQTWNTTGSPTLLKANITNTASGGSSNFMDLQIAGSSQFKVSLFGLQTCAGVTTNGLYGLSFSNQGTITSPSNGIFLLRDSAQTSFNRLQFGGTTSSYPSLKRSTTNLQARLADNSGFTFIEDLYRRAGSGSPEGVVTAPVGCTYHRTDGGANTSFYVKESGTGNTGWIPK